MRFVLAQGTHLATKANSVFLAPKKFVIGIGPPYGFYMSPSAVLPLQNFFACNYRPPLSSTHFLLNTFKIYHWYKATAEIYYLLPKSTGKAHLLVTLQFGLPKSKFEINHKN